MRKTLFEESGSQEETSQSMNRTTVTGAERRTEMMREEQGQQQE